MNQVGPYPDRDPCRGERTTTSSMGRRQPIFRSPYPSDLAKPEDLAGRLLLAYAPRPIPMLTVCPSTEDRPLLATLDHHEPNPIGQQTHDHDHSDDDAHSPLNTEHGPNQVWPSGPAEMERHLSPGVPGVNTGRLMIAVPTMSPWNALWNFYTGEGAKRRRRG